MLTIIFSAEDIGKLEQGENPHNCMVLLLRGTSKFFPLVVNLTIYEKSKISSINFLTKKINYRLPIEGMPFLE